MRSGCAINAAIEVLGDSWNLIVLRDMIFGGRRHFRELLEHNQEGIASNILSSRLKALIAAGLLTREDAVRGQRARYSLTEAGIQTVPVMVALGSWGLRHRETTHELAVRAQLLEDGGPPLWNELMDELRAEHLGAPPPVTNGPSAAERLRAAYESAMSADRPDVVAPR